jgi:endonuclease/exonuclease/phosphatase family metal-dependent hydrolase
VLIRSWNVYHGRSHPAGRRGYVAAAVRVVSADRPDVVCLQELPLWSVPRLRAWSGMLAFAARTRRAPFGVTAGRLLTAVHYARLRSAFTGQANAILVGTAHRARDLGSVRISDRLHHPRVCQAIRLDDRLVIANVHTTGAVAHREIERALGWLENELRPGEPLVLAGDFNVALELEGFSRPAGGIDDILVRGIDASALLAWPEARRRQNGVVLSDHAPVELTLP